MVDTAWRKSVDELGIASKLLCSGGAPRLDRVDPNVVSVKAEIKGGVARVRLRSHTPNFERHEMRRSGGRWEKIGADFDLKLEGLRVEREFRSGNIAGVAGLASRLLIEQE
jgi:hypothetical protein